MARIKGCLCLVLMRELYNDYDPIPRKPGKLPVQCLCMRPQLEWLCPLHHWPQHLLVHPNMKTITYFNFFFLIWYGLHYAIIYSALLTRTIRYFISLSAYLCLLKWCILITNSPWIPQHRHMCIQSAPRWQPCFDEFYRKPVFICKWEGLTFGRSQMTDADVSQSQRLWTDVDRKVKRAAPDLETAESGAGGCCELVVCWVLKFT